MGQVMTPRNKRQVVHPQDDLSQAMEMLGAGKFEQVPVIDMMGRLVGILSRAHGLSWLQIREALKLQTPPQPGS